MDFCGKVIHDKYKILEKIGEGGMSTVWLGVNITDNSEVAVKILKSGVTSDRIEDIIRFRNEANLVSKLNIPGTVKIYDVDEMDGLQYIVMEYLRGKSLQDLLSEGRQLTVSKALDIIYKICEVLKSVHNAGVIFRDLKPGNIIIDNEESTQIKLIDFGLSQMREYDFRETNRIIGTLYYISPEQCGILKRTVDERSDLYSLGVIFYQLLTGRLPFTGDHISTIIHQHAVRLPESPKLYNPAIPDIINEMILKLLRKEPEERYQSAEGLMKDLEKIREGQLNFSLNFNDNQFNLYYRTSLVGRESEYGILRRMYENASAGKGGVCLISGQAGSGKTRLAEELKNLVLNSEGLYIDGKCFSGDNKMPYGVFKDALNAYLKIYPDMNEEEKADVNNRIKHNIGELGKIVLTLNPLADEILGDCPEPVELEPESENNRFKMVISGFFYSLGNRNKPLVLLLDDLQWADEGSISILNEIWDKISDHPVLVIGTYRDNEITGSHKLSEYIRNAAENSYSVKTIQLMPFDQNQMYDFISKLLFEKGSDIRELSKFIHKRSEGNPFFALEVLKQVITEKALQRDGNRWFLSDDKLEQIHIPASIVEILIRRISGLSDLEKYVLSTAAVIGKKFELSFLFQLIPLKEEDVLQVVDKALKMQLLDQSGMNKGEINFIHDRVNEAFCAIMEVSERRSAHLVIAKLLEASNQSDIEKVVYDLTHHYYEGGDFEKAMEFSYTSAMKAKKSYAYETAYQYFQLAKNLIDHAGYDIGIMCNLSKDEFQVACIVKLAEVCTYIGKNEEAVALINSVLPRIKSRIEKADIYILLCNAYYYMGDCDTSYKYGKKGLSLLGERLPDGKLTQVLALMRELLVRLFYSFKNKSVYTKKIKKKNSEIYEKIHLYYRTLNNMTAYYSIMKFVYGIIRGLNVVERKIGWSLDLGYGIGGFGGFLAAAGKFEASLKYFEKAVDIFTELDGPLGLANEYQFMAITNEFMGNYPEAIEIINKSIALFTSLGEVKGISFSLNVLIHQYYYTGDYETMFRLIDRYLDYYNRTRDSYIKNSVEVYKTQYFRETGDLDKALECGSYIHNPSAKITDWYNYCTLCIELGITYLEKGDFGKAVSYLQKAKEINEKNSFFKQYTVLLYPYLAEAYILEYDNEQSTGTEKKKQELLKKIRIACSEALKKTGQFPTHHGASFRVMAKYRQLTGNIRQAEVLYLKSIEHFHTYGRKYEQGKSLYTYGMFLYSVLRQKEAYQYVEAAYGIFQQLNSKAYLKYCERFLGLKDKERTENPDKVSQSIRTSQQLSSITVLSQQISSILDLDILLEQIMMMAIEISGAQNGYLFIKDYRTDDFKLAVSKVTSGENAFDSSISKGILHRVMESGETVISTNAMEDAVYSGYDSVMINEVKSVLCFPIQYSHELKAICYLDNKITSSVFTKDDISLLSIFFTQAAISMENAELYRMATTDGLTDLTTHKHFMTLLDKEIQRSIRNHHSFSLIIFDIDGFKKINDSFGHQAGDEVLSVISTAVKVILRQLDIVARYGGDEFSIILPDTNTENAFLCAEKLRMAIKDTVITYDASNIKVSLSLGIAEFPKHAGSDRDLIKYADYALYISKKNGGNQSTVYTP